MSRVQYAYDPDSNRLYANNLVKSSFSELYHANGLHGANFANGLNGFNELVSFARDALSASSSGGTLDTSAGGLELRTWTLDALGNFLSDTIQGGSTVTLPQQGTTGPTGTEPDPTATGGAPQTSSSQPSPTTPTDPTQPAPQPTPTSTDPSSSPPPPPPSDTDPSDQPPQNQPPQDQQPPPDQ